jgi:hypothetical protein
MNKLRRYGLSILGAAAAGFAAAVLLAVILAIVDIYLSGHGQPTLSRQWIELPDWGIFLSRADVVLLAGALIAALAAGFALAANDYHK